MKPMILLQRIARTEDLDVSASELLVLLALASMANVEGRCWPAVETIARHARLSTRTAHTAIKALRAKGLIVTEPMPRTGFHGRQPPNRYQLIELASLHHLQPVPGADASVQPSQSVDVSSLQQPHGQPATAAKPDCKSFTAQTAMVAEEEVSEKKITEVDQDQGATSSEADHRTQRETEVRRLSEGDLRLHLRLFVDTYESAVRRSAGSFTWSISESGRRDLQALLKANCVNEDRDPAKVESWLNATVADFVAAVPSRDVQFFSDYQPKGFGRWLNKRALVKARPITSPGSKPWKPTPDSPPPPLTAEKQAEGDRLLLELKADLAAERAARRAQ